MRECGQDRNIYQRIRNPVLLSYSLLPMFRKNTSKSSYLNKFKHNENNLTFRIYKMCICAENISKYISLCACSGIIFYFSFLFAFISVAFVFKLTFFISSFCSYSSIASFKCSFCNYYSSSSNYSMFYIGI